MASASVNGSLAAPSSWRFFPRTREVAIRLDSVHDDDVEESGFGFLVAAVNGIEGAVVVDVRPDSPADHAGLQSNDVVMEANGISLRNKTINEITAIIKAKMPRLDLLVSGRIQIDESPSTPQSLAFGSASTSHHDLSSFWHDFGRRRKCNWLLFAPKLLTAIPAILLLFAASIVEGLLRSLCYRVRSTFSKQILDQDSDNWLFDLAMMLWFRWLFGDETDGVAEDQLSTNGL